MDTIQAEQNPVREGTRVLGAGVALGCGDPQSQRNWKWGFSANRTAGSPAQTYKHFSKERS